MTSVYFNLCPESQIQKQKVRRRRSELFARCVQSTWVVIVLIVWEDTNFLAKNTYFGCQFQLINFNHWFLISVVAMTYSAGLMCAFSWKQLFCDSSKTLLHSSRRFSTFWKQDSVIGSMIQRKLESKSSISLRIKLSFSIHNYV